MTKAESKVLKASKLHRRTSAPPRRSVFSPSTVRFDTKRGDLSDLDNRGNKNERRNTELHYACRNLCLIEEIEEVLDANPNDAAVRDHNGDLPLHLLGQNAKLFFHNVEGKQTNMKHISSLDSFIVNKLAAAYIHGPATANDVGHIPFMSSIVEWVQSHTSADENDKLIEMNEDGDGNDQDANSENIQDANTSTKDGSVENRSSGSHESKNGSAGSVDEVCLTESCFQVLDDFDDEQGMNNPTRSIIKVGVLLEPMVEWSFHVMSLFTELLTRSNQLIVNYVASIPNLMKTVLYIEDKEARDDILSYAIMKRVRICRASIGPWLIRMLQCETRAVQASAVEYLEAISNISVNSLHSMHELGKRGGLWCRKDTKDELYHEVEKLPGLLVVISELDANLLEKVAQTGVVQWVVDRRLFRRFPLNIASMDAFCLVLLLFFFRYSSYLYFRGYEFDYHFKINFLTFTVVVVTTTLYFSVRHCNALINMSWRNWINGYGMWGAFDIASLVVAASAQSILMARVAKQQGAQHTVQDVSGVGTKYIISDGSAALRTYCAVATGLLWLKALSFLKMLNRYFATYVLALIAITKDIFWFVVIMFGLLTATAQMLHTVLFQQKCSESTGNPFCNTSTAHSYLQVYRYFLTNFNMSDYYTGFSVVLFCLYQFSVVIVMLNVLIAIVGDSYDKAMIRSIGMFGRTRVLFLLQLHNFEKFCRRLWFCGAFLTCDKKAFTETRSRFSSSTFYYLWKILSYPPAKFLMSKGSYEILEEGGGDDWLGRLTYLVKKSERSTHKGEERMTKVIQSFTAQTKLDASDRLKILDIKMNRLEEELMDAIENICDDSNETIQLLSKWEKSVDAKLSQGG